MKTKSFGLLVASACGAFSAFAAGTWNWIDGTELPIEGKAFRDTARYYDRLPAQWSNEYTRAVWGLQRCSAGMAFRFVTDAEKIRVRWSLTDGGLSMPHMPATGMSGVDVYQFGPDPAHGGEGEAFCADRNYAVEGVHLNDWGAWNVGRAFADDVRRALGLDRRQTKRRDAARAAQARGERTGEDVGVEERRTRR